MSPNQYALLLAALLVLAAAVSHDLRIWVRLRVKIAYQMGLTAGANAARILDGILTPPEQPTKEVRILRKPIWDKETAELIQPGINLTVAIRAISAGELAFLQRTPGGASTVELVSMAVVRPEASVDDLRRLLIPGELHQLADTILEFSGMQLDEARR